MGRYVKRSLFSSHKKRPVLAADVWVLLIFKKLCCWDKVQCQGVSTCQYMSVHVSTCQYIFRHWKILEDLKGLPPRTLPDSSAWLCKVGVGRAPNGVRCSVCPWDRWDPHQTDSSWRIARALPHWSRFGEITPSQEKAWQLPVWHLKNAQKCWMTRNCKCHILRHATALFAM